jgi:hypothetical protein
MQNINIKSVGPQYATTQNPKTVTPFRIEVMTDAGPGVLNVSAAAAYVLRGELDLYLLTHDDAR